MQNITRLPTNKVEKAPPLGKMFICTNRMWCIQVGRVHTKSLGLLLSTSPYAAVAIHRTQICRHKNDNTVVKMNKSRHKMTYTNCKVWKFNIFGAANYGTNKLKSN
jgi:hypothetical protein